MTVPLSEREITLIRVALILRLDSVREWHEDTNYIEHKALLQKLWDYRAQEPT